MQETHGQFDPTSLNSTDMHVPDEAMAAAAFPGTEAIEETPQAEPPTMEAVSEPSWLEKRKMRKQVASGEPAARSKSRLSWDLRIKIAVVASFVILVAALILNRASKGSKPKVLPLASLSGGKKASSKISTDQNPSESPPPLPREENLEVSPPRPLEIPPASSSPRLTTAHEPETTDEALTLNEPRAQTAAPAIEIVQAEVEDSELTTTAPAVASPPSLDMNSGESAAVPPIIAQPPDLGLVPPITLPQTAKEEVETQDTLAGVDPAPMPPEKPIETVKLPEATTPADPTIPPIVQNPLPIIPESTPPPTEVAVDASASNVDVPPPAMEVAETVPSPSLPPAEPPALIEPMPQAPVAVKTPELSTPPPTESADQIAAYDLPNAGVKTAGAALSSKAMEISPESKRPVSTDAQTPATDIEPIAHVVRSGENFWTIARYHYGSGRFYKALWFANRDQAKAPEDLYVGTVIRVPPIEALDRSQIEPVPRGQDASRIASTKTGSVQDSRTKRVSNPDSEGLIMLPTADPAHGVVENIKPPTSSSRTGKSLELPTRSRVVRKHETLRSIARDELGDADREVEILSLNRDLEASDDGVVRLRPGTTLKLPDDTRRR